MPKRIFVTGMGVVSPLGTNAGETWNAMVAGKSGAATITSFDTSSFRTRFACAVKGLDPGAFLDRKELKRMDRFTQLAMISAIEAVESSGLNQDKTNGDRIGVVYGSGIGGMDTYQEQVIRMHTEGPSRISPLFVPMMIGDIVPGYISIRWGFKGVNYGVQSACATSSHVIGLALMHLRAGDADVVVAGGTEAPISRIGIGGFNAMHALSTRNDAPEKASRPFDKDRDGFVIGEGAATLILETEEHMNARGGTPLAELLGYGFSADAYHLTAPAPEGEGAVRSMRAAMVNAGIRPEEVDYLNAHGTSTELNDKNETTAIKTAFGEHARKMAISSTKSMTGHLLGAAGVVEAFACSQALRNGIVPPTINYETPDPECDLDYTPNTAVKRDLKVAMSNTFGFGGHNATLVLRRVEA
ncbi:MAG: beta-ketoacyl-ACP synthase II [bacterium]